MKLIPEQIAYIEKRIVELESRLNSLRKSIIANNDLGCKLGGDDAHIDGYDFNLFSALAESQRELENLRVVLSNYEQVENQKADTIDVGTVFTAALNFGQGDIDCSEYVLIDGCSMPMNSNVNYVTISSPLGKAVMGKKVNDPICYAKPGRSSEMVTGIIESIGVLENEKEKDNSSKIHVISRKTNK